MANPPDRTKRTPEKEDRFIEALRNGSGVVLDACQEIGIGRRTAYEWREADPDFRARWEEAVEESTDRLEKEAYRRAHDGCEKPIYHQGAECGRVKEYSDTLLIFLMKGRRPEKYRDRYQQEIVGKDGGPVRIESGPDLSKLTVREREQLLAILARADAGRDPDEPGEG